MTPDDLLAYLNDPRQKPIIREAIATAMRKMINKALEDVAIKSEAHDPLVADTIRALKHKDGQP